MLKQIELMQAVNPRSSTWRRFLNQYTLDQLAQNMTNEGRAEALGWAHLLFDDHTYADEWTREVRRVRLDDVRHAAFAYIRRIHYAFLGDTTLMSGEW